VIRVNKSTFRFGSTPKICQANSPQARVAASSSRNAVGFSSACTTNRFPSPRGGRLQSRSASAPIGFAEIVSDAFPVFTASALTVYSEPFAAQVCSVQPVCSLFGFVPLIQGTAASKSLTLLHKQPT
jgi:hypothetical protein